MMPVVKKEEDQATQTGTVVIGAIAKRSMLAGEPIGLESIIQPGDKSIVSAILPPGMRAISVPISTESAAAGFINPGDRVDVLLASNVRSAVGDSDNKRGDVIVNWSTETILHDVTVLAIDQRLSKNKEDGPAMIGKTATLEVSPTDAERLLAAQQLGSLSLVLRSMVDEAKPDGAAPLDDTYDDPILFTSDKEVSKGLAALSGGKKGGGDKEKVRVNRGGALSEQSF
jgi:pilus assembly protein CpaB